MRVSALDEARLAECQVVVAATGDDKVNLVVSLLAKTEFGVPRVVARVNHPKNEWMFDESWGVDVAVSTPRMLSALVEEAVSVGDLVRLFTFRQGAAELVEMTLPSTSPLSDTAPRPLIGRRTPSRSPLFGVRTSKHLTRRWSWRPVTSCCSWLHRNVRRSCRPSSGTSARWGRAAYWSEADSLLSRRSRYTGARTR